MHLQNLKSLSEKLAARELRSVDLTDYFLSRSEKYNDFTNAYITLCRNKAMQQAEQADALLDAKQGHKLSGLPLAWKDIFCTEGTLTTCASKMLANFVAPYDASSYAKFKAINSPLIGKTNMDEFAMGSSNESSFFGSVNNPWDNLRVTGGSSGGSACVVAARLAPAAIGTDTGGSVRQPAAFCGVTGIKPTYGSISRYGMVAFASSFDQAGIFSQTAEDAAILLNHLVFKDDKDSTNVARKNEDFAANLNQSFKGVKIAYPPALLDNHISEGMRKQLLEVIQFYKNAGAKLVEVDLTLLDKSIACYYIIALAECSANLARYDGMRYGHRAENAKDLMDLYCKSRSEGFGAEVKRRILLGSYVLSQGFYDAYYLKALKIRRLIQQEFNKIFQDAAAILLPTTLGPAFKQGEKTNDPVQMYLQDLFTVPVNLAGLPALSMPIGFEEGLPLGGQLIGNLFGESQILNLAHLWQQQTDHHLQVPPQFKN